MSNDEGAAYGHTDQYRWLIGDYVPFEEGIEVKIENHLQKSNVLFGSTVFYYLTPEPTTLGLLVLGGLGLLRRGKK